jgi:hydrogenase maturation protease
MRLLVACFGNVLRGDDGAGIVLAGQLRTQNPPPGVEVVEIGIGGLNLVHELLTPADGLIVADAVDLGRPPGTVVVMRPEVPDATSWPAAEQQDRLVDAHYATPERALLLARGLGLLPDRTTLVGIQADGTGYWGEELSARAAGALPAASAQIRQIVREFGLNWPDP